ncbi:unnamed protein product [Prunus brigantina]
MNVWKRAQRLITGGGEAKLKDGWPPPLQALLPGQEAPLLGFGPPVQEKQPGQALGPTSPGKPNAFWGGTKKGKAATIHVNNRSTCLAFVLILAFLDGHALKDDTGLK